MLRFLPPPLKGFFAAIFLILNTLFWSLGIYAFAIIKLLVPISGVRRWSTRWMTSIAETWISVNSFEADLFHKIQWNISGLSDLNADGSYLVLANHQSWVDIVVLQHVLNRKIPFLRFFLKRELFYVPLLGLAWWALDFPFMRRYSKEFLTKHPEYRGRDLETTRRACERFRGTPISILNFVEGTRLTEEKRLRSNSPYKHLLPPKTGGVAFVLQSMGAQFDSVLDVTIRYPEGQPSLWSLLSGRVNVIDVGIRRIEIPDAILKGNYLEETAFRDRIQNWIREIWQEKDQRLTLAARPRA